MFPLEGNFQNTNSYNMGFENEVVEVNGEDVWGGLKKTDSFLSNHVPCGDYSTELDSETTVQFSPDFSALYDIFLDIDSLLSPQCKNDTTVNPDEPKEGPHVPLASLGIIQNYARGFKRLCIPAFESDTRRSFSRGSTFVPEPRRRLSTEDILRLAGEIFIQTSSNPLDTALPFVGFFPSEVHDVAIVVKLLFAAEKLGQKNYDHGRSLLDQCDSSSSTSGNQMERIVHYFSKALREKIDRETGIVSCKYSLKEQAMQMNENLMKSRPVILAFYREIPIYQISLYAGLEAITERVTGARRVHVIDLDIRSGIHTSVLMKALVDRIECPIELLKVTAVTTKLKEVIEETGKRLRDFATSINLSFSFNLVMVSDIQELSEEHFDLDPEDTVVVNASYAFRTMIGRPDELQSLMLVLRSINPSVMVVTEIEGKLNSPVFVNRFIEALFYFGAFFDCIEEITARDSQLRLQLESIYLGCAIRNIVVAEGDDRTFRHVNLDIWRAFFARFRMKEEELSSSSLTQANLVAKTFTCCNSCTIYKNEKSLVVGWKGTPLLHVSSWTFE